MATHLNATLATALAADAPLHFFAIEVVYPTFNLRLLDGSANLTVNGNAYTGLDATYGTLILPEAFNDGIASEAPSLSFGIQVPSNTAAAALCNPAAQGSAVSLYYGAVNRSTGAVYADPYLVWTGALDTMTWLADKNSRIVKLEAESYFGPFLDSADGWLLTNACHNDIWSGETGLEFVTDVQNNLPWGADAPRPTLIKDVLPGQANSGGSVSSGINLGELAANFRFYL